MHFVHHERYIGKRLKNFNVKVRYKASEIRYDIKGDDFDVLANTFNDLLSRLQTDFERERQFTADVSHELKTPLAVILGHANLLRRWGKNDPDRLESSLASLIREAHSMESIIGNLLQMTRIENGFIPIHEKRIVVSEMFDRLIEDTEIYAPRVTFSKYINIETIYTDGALLHQACTIVISNSVKFAGESAHIELSAEYTHGSEVCAVSISDDGPGIAQDALPHIFERFYRADESHTRSVEGAGLGLSIVSSIMRAIGGSVRAENNREKGVRIVLLLPYRSGYISSSCAN